MNPNVHARAGMLPGMQHFPGVPPGFNPYMTPTPAAGLIHTAGQLGVPQIANGQGSNQELYDYVPFNSTTAPGQVTFFDQIGQKPYPYSNLQNVNTLNVGESISVQYGAVTVLVVTSDVQYDSSAPVVSWSPAQTVSPAFNLSILELFQDNNRLQKQVSLTRANTSFNVFGKTAANYLFFFEKPFSYMPQIPFTATLKSPVLTTPATTGQTAYIGLHLFGLGSILNMKINA